MPTKWYLCLLLQKFPIYERNMTMYPDVSESRHFRLVLIGALMEPIIFNYDIQITPLGQSSLLMPVDVARTSNVQENQIARVESVYIGLTLETSRWNSTQPKYTHWKATMVSLDEHQILMHFQRQLAITVLPFTLMLLRWHHRRIPVAQKQFWKRFLARVKALVTSPENSGGLALSSLCCFTMHLDSEPKLQWYLSGDYMRIVLYLAQYSDSHLTHGLSSSAPLILALLKSNGHVNPPFHPIQSLLKVARLPIDLRASSELWPSTTSIH